MNTKLLIQGLALTTMLAGANLANAATFNLCTGVTTLTMPDTTQVEMWGYGLDPLNTGVCTATIPGPQLDVPVGDTELIINLRNTLPDATSVIIPGLSSPNPPVPTTFVDGQGRTRARAMTHEASASVGTAIYNFIAAPGTYLYQSGSHPAVQVQMGLYGGVTKDAAAGEIYSSVLYDNQIVILYSEIDPALHSAVENSTYGTSAYPTTINYIPKYFLVNGTPFVGGTTPDIPAGTSGETTLLRFINAGLETHVPVLHGSTLELIAEYGSPYPYKRKQYSFELAAGQTRDALFTPETPDRYALYDRRLRLTNNMQPQGGLMSFLEVTAVVGTPIALPDSGSSIDGIAISDLDLDDNDTDVGGSIDPDSIQIVFSPINGTVVVNNTGTGIGTGTVTYTPNANFSGMDVFSYNIRDNLGNVSNIADVTITVTGANNAPVAVDDTYIVSSGSTLNIPVLGVLANDTDVDLDPLTAILQNNVSSGVLTLNSDGSFSYTPNPGMITDSFTYFANDGVTNSTVAATVTINSPLTAATLNTPNGSGTTNLPTYNWNEVVGATNYYLWVNDSTGTVIQQQLTTATANCVNNECSFTPSIPLANGSANWWIKASAAGNTAPWSQAKAFSVGSPPGVATPIAPVGTIATSMPTYSWSDVPNTTQYYLWVDDSTGTVIQQLVPQAQANCNGTSCSVTPTVALADGNVTFWVQASNQVGNGPWSAAHSFIRGGLPVAATLISPTGNIVDSTPPYRWNAVPGSTWYYLWVNNAQGTVFSTWYTAAQAGCGSGQSICSITPTTVLGSGSGTWWIKTYNAIGNGPWSSGKTFNLQ